MEEEYFDKDSRSKRFKTSNFKKRENKREVDLRNVIIDRRLQQSLRDRYGEDYAQMLENGEINELGEKLNGNGEAFDWSEDEKSNGPKSKKNNKTASKKSKADRQKEYDEDFEKHAPKKGLKKY